MRPAHFSTISALALAAMRWMIARDELIDEFFLDQFAADVDAGGAGSGDPEFGNFIIGIELKSVDETEFLNRAHGYGGENSKIRQECDQTAHAKTCAFRRGEFHAASNHVVGYDIEFFDLQ